MEEDKEKLKIEDRNPFIIVVINAISAIKKDILLKIVDIIDIMIAPMVTKIIT